MIETIGFFITSGVESIGATAIDQPKIAITFGLTIFLLAGAV
jgi:hypothetical protein